MKTKILVGGAGGTPTLNFIRSLKKANKKFEIIGMTCSPFDLCKAKEAEKRYLVPTAKDPTYLPVLKSIIDETRPHFLHVQNDEEVYVVSKHRRELSVPTFLPDHATVEICQNKFTSFEKWKEAGLKVPRSFFINSEEDLTHAFREIKGKVWLRGITGAFGKWSLPTEDLRFAKAWVDYYQGWGHFQAAECLTPDSVTWLSIWKEGKLIVAQTRKRLYWEFANRTVSGVTGITGSAVTLKDPRVDRIAQATIFAIDSKPHGIFGVDMTYDHKGIPNPTEINIGRFFTTHYFFTEAGLNMPLIYVCAGLSKKLPPIKAKINPLPEGWVWIRGVDVLPVLTKNKEIKKWEDQLERRKKKLSL